MKIYLEFEIPFVRFQLKLIEILIYHTVIFRKYFRRKFTDKYSQYNARLVFNCPKCGCSFGQWCLTFFGFRLLCHGCEQIIDKSDWESFHDIPIGLRMI